jgi:excisionase family DNA binding protein
MASKVDGMNLSAKDVANTFADPNVAAKYPPIMTIEEAAALLSVPKATIYDWSSRGLLRGCGRKVGKHLRFFRDRLILKIFNEGLSENEQ